MSRHISTLEEWQRHKTDMERYSPDYFKRYPLRAMTHLGDGYYVFGYEIGGYGTTVGCTPKHKHRSTEQAEACGRRFLAGIPTWHVWRKRKAEEQA